MKIRRLVLIPLMLVLAPCLAKAEWPFVVRSTAPHSLQLLNNGLASLELRLRMIERSKKRVLITTNTWDADDAGILVLQALQARAKKARLAGQSFDAFLLLDYFGVGCPGLSLIAAKELHEAGIELRYFHVPTYDGAKPVPKATCLGAKVTDDLEDDVMLSAHHLHEKLFIIDDDELVMGGRNMGNKYYELHNQQNAVDRDLWVSGEVVAASIDTFFALWNDKFTVPATTPVEGSPSPGYQVLGSNPKQVTYFAQIRQAGSRALDESSPSFQIMPSKENGQAVTFVSDAPGYKPSDRRTTPQYNRWLTGTQENLTIENLYFFPIKDRLAIFEKLLKDGKHISVLTNSIRSFVNPLSALGFVRANSVLKLAKTEEEKNNLHISLMTGDPLTGRLGLEPPNPPVSWMLHTKTLVRDHKDTFVSSYNLDAISAEHNVEGGLFVENFPDLAKAVESDIGNREDDAAKMEPTKEFYWSSPYSPFYGMDEAKRVKEELEILGMDEGAYHIL